MNKAQLEKLRGSKIANQQKQAGPHPVARDALDRRERRRRDQALGLVPFAVKLDGALAARIRALAASRGGDVNALVAELLKKGLGEG